MTDANLAKPQAFETKQHPGAYSPAPVPEFHQQTRDPGYSNSTGPDGDDGGQEWATSDAADGKFTEQSDDSSTEKKTTTKSSTPAKSTTASK